MYVYSKVLIERSWVVYIKHMTRGEEEKGFSFFSSVFSFSDDRIILSDARHTHLYTCLCLCIYILPFSSPEVVSHLGHRTKVWSRSRLSQSRRKW